jgi:MFS transporter, DHA1 family, inner membrane transport protein
MTTQPTSSRHAPPGPGPGPGSGSGSGAGGGASGPGWARPVAVLALGSFAMGTDSFVVAGVLPQIAHGLHESTAATGQVITSFALTYGLTVPFLAAVTGRLPRKPLMAGALALFVLANLASAAAPSLTLLLLARVAAAIGAALYTPNASAAAATLAGPARRGKALAAILGGITIGSVCGVPVGTAIGQHLSWHATLVFVAAVAAVGLVGLLAMLPSLPTPPAVPVAARLRVIARGRVLAPVVFMFVTAASSIMVYTYIADILGTTAHATGTTLAIALLLWGVGGTAGTFGSGWLADRWGAERTLVLAMLVLAGCLALLAVVSSTGAVMVVMLVYGAGSWGVPAPNNHRLTALVPEQPTVVISYNSAGTYLGQALGAAVGGILLGHAVGARELCVVGAVGSVLALLVHLAIGRPKQT